MKELIRLFLVFAKIGAVTFGGGYAMLPILQREVVEKRGWATEEELLDYYAIGQCSPGVIAVNVGTFIGYKKKGIIGAILATLGVVFPSVVIITILSAFISNFAGFQIVKYAMSGIRVCVCALVLSAVCTLWKKAIVDKVALMIFAVALIVAVFEAVPTAIIVVVSGVVGYVVRSVLAKKGGSKND